MAGIQAIIDQILGDAKIEADLIQDEAKLQIEEAERKALQKAGAQAEEILLKAEQDCREEERRFYAIMGLESRKEELSKKRACIEEAFARAKQKLLDLDDSKYVDFLFSLLKKCGSGGGAIWFSERDERFFDQAFLKKAKDEISADITLGGLRDSIRSGFILACGEAEINCTLDSVVRQARDKLESEVARILFGR